MEQLKLTIANALGKTVAAIAPLSGGCVAEVYKVRLADGSLIVAKLDRSQPARASTEAAMLVYLALHSSLPVPAVLHDGGGLLLMEFIEGGSSFSGAAEENAAELLATLHNISSSRFGFDSGTFIGGLHQPNDWQSSWLEFFRDRRLLHMAELAVQEGRMPHRLLGRIEVLARRLNEWLTEPARPSLIHGDVWTTNVLARGNRISGFLDPAIYFAHAEIELAFITLFNTFGEAFFRRYHEIRPIEAGFMAQRRDIYNLYPLLVHVRLFGGGYVRSVDTILARMGC